ncbi:hypothetical protein PLEOSDRAFT_1088723 [Pleurotus ostreatus PC15]|uniref:Uncharacterized protein n=1 Tax=Pleurotus ostreatus (strain PC15) TaxID=1137138 RepID=A0A067NWB3_PLEO1|nr:hypothetical protein PLEOSDRAFT_1088723 [Pleurotus ostreatus PC15]
MNRHHPYGGGAYEAPMNRRGGSPSGGPDRSHRFQDRGGGAHRGRGFGRGRGGGGGYGGGGGGNYDGNFNSANAYDQPPPQGDVGTYGSYEGGSQDSFYSNSYGNGNSQNSNYPSGPDFNQTYGQYEGALETLRFATPVQSF